MVSFYVEVAGRTRIRTAWCGRFWGWSALIVVNENPVRYYVTLEIIISNYVMMTRDARLDNASVLASFNLKMARESEGKQLDPETVKQGVRYVFEHPEEGFYLLAETDDQVVGGLLITKEWSDWRNGHFWWIQSVFVKAAYRRQGVYAALHEEVVKRARASGMVCGIRLYVDADNQPARNTYETLGMEASHYRFYEQMLT